MSGVVMILSLLGVAAALTGHRIETVRAVGAYYDQPTAATERAMDEALAADRRGSWVTMSVCACTFVAALAAAIAAIKRLETRSI